MHQRSVINPSLRRAQSPSAPVSPSTARPMALHTISLRAQDLAGNVSNPVSTSFTLDTKPPTILVTKPTASLTTNANVTIEGQVADIGTGVATLTATVDGGTASPVSFDSTGDFTLATSLPLDGTGDGRIPSRSTPATRRATAGAAYGDVHP